MGAKEVAAGAEWLDEVSPGWERKIDFATFKLADCHECVCGQALRDLAYKLWHGAGSGYDYALKLADEQFALKWAIDHGFYAGIEGWDIAERLWIALIKERFDTGNLSDGDVW